jgi:sirohydrochlorin ferrochelatase
LNWTRPACALVIASAFGAGLAAQDFQNDGLLLVAHGARAGAWNERVIAMFGKVDWPGPKAVAFLTGRTADEELHNVAKRMDATGVKSIVIVPLLVSSFSEHYEEIRYYGRDRKDAPDHHEHEPLKTRAAVLVAPAMDSDRLLGRILSDQIRASSTNPSVESVILVGHGPNEDVDNERWLACLKVQAGYLQYVHGFRHVDVATLRDDAPKEVKDAAVAHLRDNVKRFAADSTVLVQPVLISAGHLQGEIAGLLKDLPCKISPSGVANHPLAPEWIRQQAVTQLRTRTESAAVAQSPQPAEGKAPQQ